MHPDWPCHKGCDDCCRSLASEPRVSEKEWQRIAQAIDALPIQVAEPARQRIREAAGRARPVSCGLLDPASGACLIYEARPIACRSYGFYAEREKVLGCSRIEAIAREAPDVLWGNHAALDADLQELGEARELSVWLESGY